MKRWTRVTSAPRLRASRARATPVFPEARLVRILMGSMDSAFEPLVIRILFPLRSAGPSSLSTSCTTRWLSANLALPSSMRGSMRATPISLRICRFRMTAGWRYMASCMAGTTATGLPLPRAVVAKVVTGVSSMPLAILPMVLAVAGATRKRSAFPPTPQNKTCSTRPVISVITGWVEAYSRA